MFDVKEKKKFESFIIQSCVPCNTRSLVSCLYILRVYDFKFLRLFAVRISETLFSNYRIRTNRYGISVSANHKSERREMIMKLLRIWPTCVVCVCVGYMYVFNRYTVRANGSLPRIPVSSGLSTCTAPTDGRVSHCEKFYPRNHG